MARKNVFFWAVALVTVLLDQVTKIWVYTNLELYREQIEVIPGFFSIVHAQNPGAALGILRDFEWRVWLFIGFTIVAMGLLISMLRQLKPQERFLPVVLGMIFGGAVGNGIDRVHKQTVTDFLRFYTENEGVVGFLKGFGLPNEYPSFNIADIALVVGVGLFVVHYLWLEEDESEPASPDGEPTPSSPES